jgi:hypothetical protein
MEIKALTLIAINSLMDTVKRDKLIKIYLEKNYMESSGQ